MNVLLVNPVARAWARPNCFPTGLGYIASAILHGSMGGECWVKVVDFNAERHLWPEKVLARVDYDVLGITAIITQYKEVKRIASISKRYHPNAKIMCGGPLASSLPAELLLRAGVDIAVKGEGELAVMDALWDLREGRYRDYYQSPPQPKLENFPWPAYRLFPVSVYLGNPIGPYNTRKWQDGAGTAPVSINLIATRGCPYNCLFCFHNYMGEGYRKRPVQDVVEEMKWLMSMYGVEYFHFADDAMACSKKWIGQFCNAVEKLGVRWSCTGRANLVTDDMARAMADAGCVGLWYGLESGSPEMLKAMNKKATLQQYRRAITINRKYFQFEDYTFIVGTPGETDATINESIVFCKEMGIVPTAVFYMTPYPGTPLFRQLMFEDSAFAAMVHDVPRYDKWLESLGEQGEKVAWNCSGAPDEKLHEWHQRFIEETGAWNKIVHQEEKGK